VVSFGASRNRRFPFEEVARIQANTISASLDSGRRHAAKGSKGYLMLRPSSELHKPREGDGRGKSKGKCFYVKTGDFLDKFKGNLFMHVATMNGRVRTGLSQCGPLLFGTFSIM